MEVWTDDGALFLCSGSGGVGDGDTGRPKISRGGMRQAFVLRGLVFFGQILVLLGDTNRLTFQEPKRPNYRGKKHPCVFLLRFFGS